MHGYIYTGKIYSIIKTITTMQKVTANAVYMSHINGKIMYYITLENGNGKQYHVSVGKKTHDACQELQAEELTPKLSPKVEKQ